jgi:hypothetical protein
MLKLHLLTESSLSEYGCIKGNRQFGEIASIYGTDMTSVYSGGLVYEYSLEGPQPENKYGLVKIENGQVSELDDFAKLQAAFAKTKLPTGDGGYKSSGSASQCPTKSATWNVTMTANQLPAFPDGADLYLKNGVKGQGPGLTGTGSQDAGSDKPTLAGEADGAVTSGGAAPKASPSKGAASSLRATESGMAPLLCGAIILVSSLFGGALLF